MNDCAEKESDRKEIEWQDCRRRERSFSQVVDEVKRRPSAFKERGKVREAIEEGKEDGGV